MTEQRKTQEGKQVAHGKQTTLISDTLYCDNQTFRIRRDQNISDPTIS